MDLSLYTDLGLSAALVTEKTGLAPTDLSTLLEVYAGRKGELPVYRPYFVAAWLLSTRKSQLTEAEGAKFVDPLAVAREYLAQQRTIDVTLGLKVPLGAEALAVNLVMLREIPGTGVVPIVRTW